MPDAYPQSLRQPSDLKPLDKKPVVYFAYPTYSPQEQDTVNSIRRVVRMLDSRQWGVIEHYAGMSDVVDTRNCFLTRWYDTHPESDYLVMIDHDMVFPWEMIVKMFYIDRPVVGIVYSKRDMPSIDEKGTVNYWDVTVGMPMPEPGPIIDGFQEWKYVGGGVLLIRREVVTAMLEKFPEINDFSDPGWLAKNKITRVIGAFNKLVLPEGTHLSEDYSFCWRARECGFPIWAAVDWEVGHIGKYQFRMHPRSMLGLDKPEETQARPRMEYIPALDYDQQEKEEIDWLAEQIKGATSLLEIGSAAGQSLRYLSKHMAPGAKIRAIDLGEFPEEAGKYAGASCKQALRDTADELRSKGFDVEVLFGDSHSPEALAWAREHGDYDAVFIDGDHTLEGVRKDYALYAPLGKIVALHDIVNENTDVPKFWKELRGAMNTTSLVGKDSAMGIGLIRNEAMAEAAA